MRNSKYQNIFNYYRGQNSDKDTDAVENDYQIEDNTTKALINTLEKSINNVTIKFLEKLGVSIKRKANYELQPKLDCSRPDAVISFGNQNIYIESKVAAKLDIQQVQNHINGFENQMDILLVITLNEKDAKLVSQLPNVIFITWNEIWKHFSEIETDDKVSSFLIDEFSNYLEGNNMTEFNTWKQEDFNAFLFIEQDSDKECRRNVKVKFSSFMKLLHKQLQNRNCYPTTKINIQTKIEEDTIYIWGNFVEKEIKNSIDIAHFLLRISANGISIGINIEGAKPTREFTKKLNNTSQEFTNICEQLNGYSLILRKRWKTERIRIFDNKELINIYLGENYNLTDTEYLMNKISQFDLIEINIEKDINKNDKIIKSNDFIINCLEELIMLEKIYYYCIS